MKQARAESVSRIGDGVEVRLVDGRTVTGSHVLMCVGSVPNTTGLGLEHVGLAPNAAGFIEVDRVSRTLVPGIYAAGDCTGVLLLASVAAMQGRRGGAAAAAQDGGGQRLHPSRDRHGRHRPRGGHLGCGAGPDGDVATERQRPRQDAGLHRWLRQDLLPAGVGRGDRRFGGRAAGVRADPLDRGGRPARPAPGCACGPQALLQGAA